MQISAATLAAEEEIASCRWYRGVDYDVDGD